jgi:hypothetical protein
MNIHYLFTSEKNVQYLSRISLTQLFSKSVCNYRVHEENNSLYKQIGNFVYYFFSEFYILD